MESSESTNVLSAEDLGHYSTLLKLVQNDEYRVIVSLGGGSTPGICGNVALLKMLEELELKDYVKEIWGTSAGSIVGGAWASGTPVFEVLNAIAGLDPKKVVDVCKFSLVKSILLRPFGQELPDGFILGNKLADVIDSCLKVKTFEKCAIPFRCVAVTDDGQNRRKVFRRGKMLPAIRSSMSLPGVFVPRPKEEGEETSFYDGGLVEKTPLYSPISEHLRLHPKKKLLIIATHFSADSRRKTSRGFLSRFIQSMYALEDTLWEYQLAEARRKHKQQVDLLILNPHIIDDQHFNFSRSHEHYRNALKVFEDSLQDSGIALTFGKV